MGGPIIVSIKYVANYKPTNGLNLPFSCLPVSNGLSIVHTIHFLLYVGEIPYIKPVVYWLRCLPAALEVLGSNPRGDPTFSKDLDQ